MIRDKQADHIKSQARTFIRYSPRTELALARMYGTSVATVRLIRATAVPNHPVRLASKVRKMSGQVTRSSAPARPVKPLSLHVEGGPDLPRPLR